MFRKIAIAGLLCVAMGSAHAAAPAGTGIGRIPVLGPLIQGLLPGGTAYIPILGIPIPAISTEPLLGILNPLLNGLSRPLLTLGGPVVTNVTNLVSPLLSVTHANSKLGNGAALPPLGATLPGLRASGQ